MSLRYFDGQSSLFSTYALKKNKVFTGNDRFELFAQKVYPALIGVRTQLEACYSPEAGRPALEPVLLLGVSILQFLEGLPDRKAVEMLHYHVGWNLALNRNVGDRLFHPTTLVYFRHRLIQNNLTPVAFEAVLKVLIEEGLVPK